MKKLPLIGLFLAASLVGCAAFADGLYRVSFSGSSGAYYDSFAAAVAAADTQDGALVELLSDDLDVWNEAVTVSHTMTIASGGSTTHTLRRAGTSAEILLGTPSAVSTLTISNIVIDGGAVWTQQDFVRPTSTSDITAADTANLANTGVGQSLSLISFSNSGKMKLLLANGATIQNVHAGIDHSTAQYSSYGTISACKQYTTYITMEPGSAIRDCRGEGATINAFGSGSFVMNGGTIDHCYASRGNNFTYSGVIRIHGYNDSDSTKYSHIKGGRIINCMSSRPYSNENGGVIEMARTLRVGAVGKELYITNNWGYSLGAVASPNSYPMRIGGGKVVIKDNFMVGDVTCDVGIRTGKFLPASSQYPLALEGSLASGSDIGVSWEDGDTIGVRVGSNTSVLNEGAKYIHNVDKTLRAMVSSSDSSQLLWRDGTQSEFEYTSSNTVERVYDGQPHGISDTIEVTDPASGYTIRYATEETGPYSTVEPTYTDVGKYTIHFELTAPNYIAVTNKTVLFITEAPQAGTARVSVDGGASWTDFNSAVSAIAAANVSTQAAAPIVELLSYATFAEPISINRAMLIRSGAGGPYTFKRTSTSGVIDLTPLSNVVFTVAVSNLVLDGGAKWENGIVRPTGATDQAFTDANDATLINCGVGNTDNFIELYGANASKTVYLEMDQVTVQNVQAGANGRSNGWGFTGTIGYPSDNQGVSSKLTCRSCKFLDCRGQGPTVSAPNSLSALTLEDCEFRGCFGAKGNYYPCGVIRVHGATTKLTRLTVHDCMSLHLGAEGGAVVDLARATTLTDVVVTNNFSRYRGGVSIANANQISTLAGGVTIISNNLMSGDVACNVYVGIATPSATAYPFALTGVLESGSYVAVSWSAGASIGTKVGTTTLTGSDAKSAKRIVSQDGTLSATVNSSETTSLIWMDATQQQFEYTYDAKVACEYDGQPHGVGDHVYVTEPETGYTLTYSTALEGPFVASLTYTEKGVYTIYVRLTAPNYLTQTFPIELKITEPHVAGSSRVSLDGGATWASPASTAAAIALANASEATEAPVVELLSDATFETRLDITRSMVIRSGAGGPYVFMRNDDDAWFNIATNPLQKSVFTVAISNIVLDGGAKWTYALERPVPESVTYYWDSEAVARRTAVDARNMSNWGIGACESFLRLNAVSWDNTMTLQMDDVTVRNVHAGANILYGFTGTVGLADANGQDTKIFRRCTFVNCRGQGAMLNAGNGSKVTTLEDCEFRDCYAAMGNYSWSGVIRIHGSTANLTRLLVHNCMAIHQGGEGGACVDLARATTVTDSVITNNYGLTCGGLCTPSPQANETVTFCGKNIIRDNAYWPRASDGDYVKRNVFVRDLAKSLKLGASASAGRGTIGVTTSTETTTNETFGTAEAEAPRAAARAFVNDTNKKLYGTINRADNTLYWSAPAGIAVYVK